MGLDLTTTPAEAVPHDLGHVQMDLSPDLDDHMDARPDDEDDDGDVDVVDDFEPVYQEIDDNHESKYAPKRPRERGVVGASNGGNGHMANNNQERLVPPQVRIERKVFPNPHLHPASMVSSTGGSEERLMRHPATGLPSAMSSSFEMTSSSETPLATTPCNPKGPQIAETSFMPRVLQNPEPSPNAAAAAVGAVGALASVSSSSPATDDVEYPYAVPHSTQMVSALATMPRRKKDNKIQINVAARDRNLPGTKDDSSTIPQETARGMGLNRTKPPTPPMRRLPSWVSSLSVLTSKNWLNLYLLKRSKGLERYCPLPYSHLKIKPF